MSSYLASNPSQGQRLSSNGASIQSSTSPYFAARHDGRKFQQTWQAIANDDTEVLSSVAPITSGFKDGIVSDRHYDAKHQSTQGGSDTGEYSPNSKRTRSIFKPCSMCCLIISAFLIYILGILTERMILKVDNSSSLTRATSLYGVSDTFASRSASLPMVTLGTYYYPWYADDFHRGDGYLRKNLGQKPVLGEYDDRDPAIIAQHLEWSKRANIELWSVSWWGKHSREDNTTREVILTHPDLLDSDFQISLFYETFGRIKEEENYSLHRVGPDMEFMCSNYFNHPNYFHIGGKPVVYMYLSRLLDEKGLLAEVIQVMRQAAQDACGQDIYIIGDHIFGPPDDSVVKDAQIALELLDAVTNYDVYGSMSKSVGSKGGYFLEDDVRRYYEIEQREWKGIVNQKNCAYIPAVSPGYNDRAVRFEENQIPLSRSLFGGAPGSLFDTAVMSARTLVDSSASSVLMVNSFNEFHEDTQIEPVTAGEWSSMAFNMTYGLSYHGYGTLYLDILRSAFRKS
ncbi:unnamed protein product [Cylindrotheca closterium]|uniref:Uncharacterized protein n=1 Tax=Cylindrotheca closterium TaxID=2856 RepID=A0AAD2FTX7_9STRA|nr:unnamed protein product [Cylindrotheca closterium]